MKTERDKETPDGSTLPWGKGVCQPGLAGFSCAAAPRIDRDQEQGELMALFQSLWIGGRLSPIEVVCIRSFLERGHAFELYSYSDRLQVPEGCVLRDARTILPEEEVFYYWKGDGKGSPAGFANLFRYKLLLEKGGWWVDTDVLCLSATLPECEISLAPEEPGRINNAIMRFPPGHPAMAWAYSEARAKGHRIRFGETGPELVTQAVQMFHLAESVAPQLAYYPIHYSESKLVIDPRARGLVESRVAGATFVHLWNEMLRRMMYSKDACPPAGSYLHQWMEDSGMMGTFDRFYICRSKGGELFIDLRSNRNGSSLTGILRGLQRILLNGSLRPGGDTISLGSEHREISGKAF